MFKEIMAKSFPNLKKTADLQSQTTQQTLSTSNTKKTAPCNTIIKSHE